MKKILFPFRIEDDNGPAFCYAAALARRQDAQLVLMNVFSLELKQELSPHKYGKAVRKKWQEALDEIHGLKGYYFKHFAKLTADLKLRTSYRIVTGHLEEEVLKVVQSGGFDLVALNGGGPLIPDQPEQETIARKILETTSTAVLFIPAEVDLLNIHHIAFANDFRPLMHARHLIKQFVALAHLFDASAEFIHISEDGTLKHIDDTATMDCIRKLEATSERYTLTVLKSSTPVKSMKTHCKVEDVGLLVAIKKQRRFINKWFHESFTGKLFENIRVPILILKDSDLVEVNKVQQEKDTIVC